LRSLVIAPPLFFAEIKFLNYNYIIAQLPKPEHGLPKNANVGGEITEVLMLKGTNFTLPRKKTRFTLKIYRDDGNAEMFNLVG
jgi:hypothetical protein